MAEKSRIRDGDVRAPAQAPLATARVTCRLSGHGPSQQAPERGVALGFREHGMPKAGWLLDERIIGNDGVPGQAHWIGALNASLVHDFQKQLGDEAIAD